MKYVQRWKEILRSAKVFNIAKALTLCSLCSEMLTGSWSSRITLLRDLAESNAGSHNLFIPRWLKFQVVLLSLSPWALLSVGLSLPLFSRTAEFFTRNFFWWQRLGRGSLLSNYIIQEYIIQYNVTWSKMTLFDSWQIFITSLGIYYNRIDHGKLICCSHGCNN